MNTPQILFTRHSNVNKTLETEINRLIYALYDLISEKIAIVGINCLNRGLHRLRRFHGFSSALLTIIFSSDSRMDVGYWKNE